MPRDKIIDYLIVGSGLFGSVFAHEMKKNGKKCLVIDKRKHIGGNVYTENTNGINVHKYGPHIFHTNSKKIWDYVNKFAEFNNYRYKPLVSYKGKLYSFPINLLTFHQLWGIQSPSELSERLEKEKINFKTPKNFEEYVLSKVGKNIYEVFFKGYTQKQWGVNPSELPSSIIKRIPIRYNYDDNYYFHKYQGIPIGGYTGIIENMLNGIPSKLGVDYFCLSKGFIDDFKKIIFTGKIDEFYNYKYGELDYRSLRFESEFLKINDFQGTAGVNYTELEIPYTRIIEHKHFEFGDNRNFTIITKEYPQKGDKQNIPYYPINNLQNARIYRKYKMLADNEESIIFGGRLAEYKYYDMHQVIASALKAVKKEIKNAK
jgi:UDP-galactopyranose mutase